MMDEEIRNLPSARKWRKYIKRGADDFWDSHGIFDLHRSGSYLSFSGYPFFFSPRPNSSPNPSDYLLFFMTLLLRLPSFSLIVRPDVLNLFVASCISLC